MPRFSPKGGLSFCQEHPTAVLDAVSRAIVDQVDVVGVPEMARILGVSRQRVYQLIEAYDDFPRPVAELAVGRIWSRVAVEEWNRLHGDRPSGKHRRVRFDGDEPPSGAPRAPGPG